MAQNSLIEERIDLSFHGLGESLRSRSPESWAKLLEPYAGKLVSSMRGELIDAYALSGVSVIVFDRRLVITTCGALDAVASIEAFLTLGDKLESLLYQRRGVPDPAPNGFTEKVEVLRKAVGASLPNCEVNRDTVVFSRKDVSAAKATNRACLQLMMQGLGASASRIFNNPSVETRKDQVSALGLEKMFPGFKVDACHFEPTGYLLNAIQGEAYFIIQVQPAASYASFEYEGPNSSELWAAASDLLKVFFPEHHRVEMFQHRADISSAGSKEGSDAAPYF